MNSKLYGNTYKIPESILSNIRIKVYNTDGNASGIKRAKNLIKTGHCTYQQLKRMKNFFDNYNGENKLQYELAGGDEMKKFVNKTLVNERQRTHKSDEIKQLYKQDISPAHVQNLKRFNEG